MAVTFTKMPHRTVWRCDQYPAVYIWKPCDKATFAVMNQHPDGNLATIKKGFRKRERAEAYVSMIFAEA